jgi:hypothetical protein
VRALVLSSAAVFPAAFTSLAVWQASCGHVPVTVALAVTAAIGWVIFGVLAAWTRPVRARWTTAETAALRGGMDLEGLLRAIPRREGKR